MWVVSILACLFTILVLNYLINSNISKQAVKKKPDIIDVELDKIALKLKESYYEERSFIEGAARRQYYVCSFSNLYIARLVHDTYMFDKQHRKHLVKIAEEIEPLLDLLLLKRDRLNRLNLYQYEFKNQDNKPFIITSTDILKDICKRMGVTPS